MKKSKSRTIRKIKTVPGSHRTGGVFEQPVGEQQYVAARHIRVGDRMLAPGDLVPTEGRSVRQMLQHGDIVPVIKPSA